MARILIDFDGTCVEHRYPKVGGDIGAVPVLRALVDAGNQLILYTMRDSENGTLDQAIRWFCDNGIKLSGTQQMFGNESWTNSKKIHADYCIDDRNIGTPMRVDSGGQLCVDWNKMAALLAHEGLINHVDYE